MAPKTQMIKIKPENIKTAFSEDNRHAYFANYFSVEVANDDVTLGFGQKIPEVQGLEAPINEIKQRIIMTHKGASVLLEILQSAVKKPAKVNKK